MSKRSIISTTLAAFCLLLTSALGSSAAITDAELRTRVDAEVKDFTDLVMVGNVTYKNEKALAKMDSNFTRLYEFKSATISFKQPDKLRIEGKLGMVKFEYIINSGTKIFRAPMVKVNKKEDYSNDPAKLQSALDVGLITPSLWKNRSVEIASDSECEAKGEIKLRLRWPKGNMVYFAWIDAEHLWLKKLEKRDAKDQVQVSWIYSEPRNVDGVIWMPTKVDMYLASGERAGASEFTSIKVNSGLSESLFK